MGGLEGEAVRLPLVRARNQVQHQTQHQLEGLERQREQDQAGVHRRAVHKESLEEHWAL